MLAFCVESEATMGSLKNAKHFLGRAKRSNVRILIDKERLGFMSRKDATVADDDVFIGDNAI